MCDERYKAALAAVERILGRNPEEGQWEKEELENFKYALEGLDFFEATRRLKTLPSLLLRKLADGARYRCPL